MLALAVAWAFAWGAHDHGTTALALDLSRAEVSRTIVLDATDGVLDVSGIAFQPGEVVDLVLRGSAGAPHRFLLAGTTLGSAMGTRLDGHGDTVVRLQAPESGQIGFVCAIPGHENLHGVLWVDR
jgi:hypothetical protein